MELGPQNHNGDGLLGLNSIIIVYMDPLGKFDAAARRAKSRSIPLATSWIGESVTLEVSWPYLAVEA